MQYIKGKKYLVSDFILGQIEATFEGFKETPSGLLPLFKSEQINAPQPYTKFQVIKTI